VSSHLLSEVAQSVDDVVVIAHGTLRANGPLESVLGSPEGPATRVRAADNERLKTLLGERGVEFRDDGSGTLLVSGGPEQVADLAAENGIALRELAPVSRSLEEAFFALTGEGEER
jgi:ABC-2 type transport system ATP-binding protein